MGPTSKGGEDRGQGREREGRGGEGKERRGGKEGEGGKTNPPSEILDPPLLTNVDKHCVARGCCALF